MTEADTVARCCELGREMARLHREIGEAAAERQRLVTELHFAYGWTTRRIAAALGISYPRVSQILNQAKWGDTAGGKRFSPNPG